MPILPMIQPRPVPIGADLGRVTPDMVGGGVAQGFHALASASDVYARVQQAADHAEATMLQQTTARQIEGAIQNAKDTNGDPDMFEQKATEDTKTIFENVLSGARNQNVKGMLQQRLADDLIKAQNDIKHHGATLRIDGAKANFDLAIDEAVSRRIDTTDPVKQSKIDSEMSQNLNDLIATGVYKKGEGVNKVIQYRDKVLLGSAQVAIKTDPGKFLTDMGQGKWDEINLDTRLKLGDQARKRIEDTDRQNEKVLKQAKEIVEQDWYSRAAKGAIPDAELQDAIDNKHPFITPEKAITFKRLNDNPVTGEGNQQVLAIMQDYHGGESSFGRITTYRNQLLGLAKQLGAPNELISKALDELQTDERTMIGINASAVNRAQTAAVEDYNANNPLPPINLPMFSNQRRNDEAKIKQAVRKGQDPKQVVKQKTDAAKRQVDKIPDADRKVMELTR